MGTLFLQTKVWTFWVPDPVLGKLQNYCCRKFFFLQIWCLILWNGIKIKRLLSSGFYVFVNFKIKQARFHIQDSAEVLFPRFYRFVILLVLVVHFLSLHFHSWNEHVLPGHIFCRDYALSGDYRHMIVKPEEISWSTHHYSDPTEPLVLGDLEILRGRQLQHTGKTYQCLFALP